MAYPLKILGPCVFCVNVEVPVFKCFVVVDDVLFCIVTFNLRLHYNNTLLTYLLNSPPCNPTFGPLSSANSPRALGMLPHLQLSPVWEQEARAVQQGETSSAKSRSLKELWPNATPIEQDLTGNNIIQ